jgi:hypothetical protein
MKPVAACVLAMLSLGVAQASDFVGAYALISKVTLEPSAEKPERIRIEGVFAMAKPNDVNYYLGPQRGVLYFSLPAARPEQALAEWRDLKSVEGKRTVVSVGNRSQFMSLPVRMVDDKAPPVPYQLGLGITVNRANTEYAPIKSLLEFR